MATRWRSGLALWCGLAVVGWAPASAQNVQDLLDQQELIDVVPPAQAPDGTWVVSIAYLSDYELDLPRFDDPDGASKLDAQIPERIRELNGKEVLIEGFPLPTEFRNGAVTNFILTPYLNGCCFGGMPRFNEVIQIEIPPPGRKSLIPDYGYQVKGKLIVGAETAEEGFVTNIYRVEMTDLTENRSYGQQHKKQKRFGW